MTCRPAQPIVAEDLRITQDSTSTDASFVSAAHLGELVGQTPRGYVPAGTPLNLGMIQAAGSALSPGVDVVGAVLPAGAIPVGGLQPGDVVDVLVVSKATALDRVGGPAGRLRPSGGLCGGAGIV